MNFSTISILLPTRGRVQKLDRALNSIRENAHDRSKIEVVFRCDIDDEETQQYLKDRGEFFLVGPREKGYASLPKFMNQCAAASTGDIIMMLNDDILVETRDWDIRLLEFANKFPDGIFNIGISTGLNDKLFPFSIISRKVHRVLGFVNDERLVFSDIFLLDVMNSFGRALPLPSITITHEWAGNDNSDITRLEAARHENSLVFDGTPGDPNNHKKNWQQSYRTLHDKAVQEAVEKLTTALIEKNVVQQMPEVSNHTFFISDQTELIKDHEESWDQSWDRLLETLKSSDKRGQSVLIAPLKNKKQIKPLREIFGEVIALEYDNTVSSSMYYSCESYLDAKIYKGPIASTNFLFHFRDICLGPQSRINIPFGCLIIDNEQYPVSSYPISMAIYYVIKKILLPGATIVFLHGQKNSESQANNDQFVKHLEEAIDGYKHKFDSFRDPKTGFGFSIESYNPHILNCLIPKG